MRTLEQDKAWYLSGYQVRVKEGFDVLHHNVTERTPGEFYMYNQPYIIKAVRSDEWER